MELNGLANITILINMATYDGTIDRGLADKILEEAKFFEKYLLALKYIPDLKWHEVYPNPHLFPTNDEVFKHVKATNYKGNPADMYLEFLKNREKLNKAAETA